MQDMKDFDYLHDGLQFRPTQENLQRLAELSIEKGIIAQQEYPKNILKGSELHEKLTTNCLLISIARPLLNKPFLYFSNKTNLLLLTDTDGYIIDLISSPEILLSCFNSGIMLGTCMDYFSYGTNAISVSKFENRPITLLGKEHFCHALKSYNCLASPLKIGSNTIAFLDISTIEPNDLIHLSSFIVLLSELIQLQLLYNCNFKGDKATPQKDNLNPKEQKILFFGTIMVNSNLPFTLRETEILYELYMRKSSHEIANKLCISSNTLKTHLKHIYQKLDVCTLNDCLHRIGLLFNI